MWLTWFLPRSKGTYSWGCTGAMWKFHVNSLFCWCQSCSNLVTHCSQSGILIFVNRAPIIWYSKCQNTVETSTLGNKFVAMQIAVELIESLWYKLWMFGIPIDGPMNVYCDNETVTKNAIYAESTLKKKHNSIAYHWVHESVATGTICVTKEDGKTNLADVLTKLLPQATKDFLCNRFMYWWPRLSSVTSCDIGYLLGIFICGLTSSRFQDQTSCQCFISTMFEGTE